MPDNVSTYEVQKILELKRTSIAPRYLVRDEKTNLYGVQTHLGNFEIEPKYPLDEDYDFNKEYAFARVGKDEKLFLLEADAVSYLLENK